MSTDIEGLREISRTGCKDLADCCVDPVGEVGAVEHKVNASADVLEPARRVGRAIPLTGVVSVTALPAGPADVWAAIEPKGGDRHTAQVGHIDGSRVVSRTTTAGVWVLAPRKGHTDLAAVEPSGSLKVAATLPADARSLTAASGALWTANPRGSTVARITGYTRSH